MRAPDAPCAQPRRCWKNLPRLHLLRRCWKSLLRLHLLSPQAAFGREEGCGISARMAAGVGEGGVGGS